MSPDRLLWAALLLTQAVPATDLLDTVLVRRVHDGLVDYAGLKADQDFKTCVDGLTANDPESLLTRDERLARWINLYNLLVLEGVTQRYPIKSVSAVGPVGRWWFFRHLEFMVAGKPLTLDTIEHDRIRAVYQDPRVHFALVCASAGCPRLPSHSFHAATLQAELDDAARRFINDPSKVRLDREADLIHLSSIFKWYEEDFVKASGSVTAFVGRYLEGGLPQGTRIEYLEYSWVLNDAHTATP